MNGWVWREKVHNTRDDVIDSRIASSLLFLRSSAAELRQAGSSMISSGFWYGTSTGIWYLVSGIWYHTVARSRRIHNKGQWQQQSN